MRKEKELNKDFLTAQQTAEFLGVSYHFLAIRRIDKTKSPQIPFYKIGAKILYKKQDIEKALKGLYNI